MDSVVACDFTSVAEVSIKSQNPADLSHSDTSNTDTLCHELQATHHNGETIL
jgi:hypothetical protein